MPSRALPLSISASLYLAGVAFALPATHTSTTTTSLSRRDCPDTTIHSANLQITFWNGTAGEISCTGRTMSISDIDYAVSHPMPRDPDGNQPWLFYQLSRDLQPWERIDWSEPHEIHDQTGVDFNWACGEYMTGDTLHGVDPAAKANTCTQIGTMSGWDGQVDGQIRATCFRISDSNSCQNEPQAGPNIGFGSWPEGDVKV